VNLIKCKKNLELQEFIKRKEFKPPLRPRESLFGGRTNAIKLYYKCAPGEKIKYYDITSLYPYVQKVKSYPCGAPKILTENLNNDLKDYFGLVQCRVIPPKNLYLPILPSRINDKLVFCLCYTCACQKQSSKCTHGDALRAIEGTWVSEEIKLALQYGYKIDKVFSVWTWNKQEKYDPVTKSGGLFTEYVNKFLKIKQEASGFPNWCSNEDDKDLYINQYYEREGIKLDKLNIKSNPGLRNIAKLLLNSMWGRYCLNTNKSKFKLLKEPHEFYDFLLNEQYLIDDVYFPNDNVAQVFYSEKQESHDCGRDSNVVLGAFVTAYGRMHLYEELAKLNDRVLYFDTDSIIFISREGDYEPELADYLGYYTNEIKPSDGDHIVEFVSGGPKNYGYLLDSGKMFSKVKGFSSNFSSNSLLNFNTIKELVTSGDESKRISVEQNTFKRNKNDWTVKTEIVKKLYSRVYDKRILLDDLSTLPYGY
jgi:hypothetical protein